MSTSEVAGPGRDNAATWSDGVDLPDLSPLVAPRKLAQDAAAVLREQILSGGLRRGTHLVEAKLASRLGVSRGTIREAFKALVTDGLIEEEPRRGAFVVTLSADDVREIYEIRAAVEGCAARRLAGRADPEAIQELVAVVAEIRAAAQSGDLAAVRRADLRFHERLCALSGNGRLHQIFMRYVPAIQTLLHFDELPYASLDASADEHRALLDAIESRDVDLSSRLLEAHVVEAGERVAGYFEDAESG
jgi:DNA-binding GntR family transcriptional regulator